MEDLFRPIIPSLHSQKKFWPASFFLRISEPLFSVLLFSCWRNPIFRGKDSLCLHSGRLHWTQAAFLFSRRFRTFCKVKRKHFCGKNYKHSFSDLVHSTRQTFVNSSCRWCCTTQFLYRPEKSDRQEIFNDKPVWTSELWRDSSVVVPVCVCALRPVSLQVDACKAFRSGFASLSWTWRVSSRCTVSLQWRRYSGIGADCLNEVAQATSISKIFSRDNWKMIWWFHWH